MKKKWQRKSVSELRKILQSHKAEWGMFASAPLGGDYPIVKLGGVFFSLQIGWFLTRGVAACIAHQQIVSILYLDLPDAEGEIQSIEGKGYRPINPKLLSYADAGEFFKYEEEKYIVPPKRGAK